MKGWHYIVCCVIIIIGLLSIVNLFEMFGAKSGEYGTPITIEKVQDLNLVQSYDFGIIQFTEKKDTNIYTYNQTYAPEEFNGEENNYTIFFNSQPVQNIKITSGALSGDFTLNYYDLDGQIESTSQLNIYMFFYEGTTEIRFEITNEDDSLSYFTTYMNFNGANLTLYTKGEKS